MRKLELLNKYTSKCDYYARTWDREDAYRYIFRFGSDVIEAGFFVHYKNNSIAKYVVELSTSFGCPVGCLHCASGGIKNYSKLSSEEIVMMFEFLILNNSIIPGVKLLITFSGIGEGALQSKEIFNASEVIYYKNKNVCFNISTVGFNSGFLRICDRFSKRIPINYVQITYIHYNNSDLIKIIPSKYGDIFDFESLVECIGSSKSRIRLNFVMMGGINDNLEHWAEFYSRISCIKKKVVVRISKLNPTKYSDLSGIVEPSIMKLEKFKAFLENKGVNCHIFTPLQNNNMNCGQLVWEY